MKNHGTSRTRGLAAELKDLRTKAGLNTRDAAHHAGMSAASLNRLELGNRAITPEEVSALLVVYGVTGPARRSLLTRARDLSLPGWWEHKEANGIPKHLSALTTFEAEATQIAYVVGLWIPGLIQIPEYIHEVLAAGRVAVAEREHFVSIRLRRQAILARRRTRFLTVIDEAALRRRVGGPQLMAKQLRHVVDVAARPNIEVRVVPFNCGGHAGLDGHYVTLDFAKAPTIVYLEHKRFAQFVDDPELIRPYQEATESLREVALSHADSVDFISQVAADYDKA